MNQPVPSPEHLKALRAKLGLSIHAMADLLYTSQQTYRNWETGGRPRTEAADRLRRFVSSVEDQLARLEESGVDVSTLMPLNLAASQLGIPHEILFHTYRDGGFEAYDMGMLGIWVNRDDLEEIGVAAVR